MTVREYKTKVGDFESEKSRIEKKMSHMLEEKGADDKEYAEMKKKFESMSNDISKKDEFIVKFADQASMYKEKFLEFKRSQALGKDKKIQELESQLHQKDVEVQVLNQMITSANKMVQVKHIECGRMQKKLAHSAKYLKSMNAGDRMRMEQEKLDMSYIIGHTGGTGMTAGNATHTSITHRTRQASARSNKPGSNLGNTRTRIKQLGAVPTKDKIGSGGDSSRPQSKTILKHDKLEDSQVAPMMDDPILEKDDNLERSDDFDNSHNNRTAEDIIRQIENEDDLVDKKSMDVIQKMVDN